MPSDGVLPEHVIRRDGGDRIDWRKQIRRDGLDKWRRKQGIGNIRRQREIRLVGLPFGELSFVF